MTTVCWRREQYGIRQSTVRRTIEVRKRATRKKYFLDSVRAVTTKIKIGSSIRTYSK